MRGFTIIEVILVLSLMGVIFAVIHPYLDKIEEYEESRPVDCDEPTIENQGGLLCDRS